ncbi:hypothetical protein GCM10010315_46200 [Streptomyces luteosporeus]|uniref:Uncharacterized protein n=1 Tax=Streptomyces luteosporeus TaxID=173856 RepID=A0ABN3U0G9_9ACTN
MCRDASDNVQPAKSTARPEPFVTVTHAAFNDAFGRSSFPGLSYWTAPNPTADEDADAGIAAAVARAPDVAAARARRVLTRDMETPYGHGTTCRTRD